MAVANSTTNGKQSVNGKPSTNGPPKLLTRAVKGLGHLLGPETPTGKAFVYLERGITQIADRVGRSERFLDFSGKMLNQGLRTRAAWVAYQEQWLRAMRLPTWSEMHEVRDELREVRDQMEALSSQLEVVLESIEEQRRK
jgi:Poly(R)-hydroxyalkanoic acid synthase subunit (PHA_synth_III_E)